MRGAGLGPGWPVLTGLRGRGSKRAHPVSRWEKPRVLQETLMGDPHCWGSPNSPQFLESLHLACSGPSMSLCTSPHPFHF